MGGTRERSMDKSEDDASVVHPPDKRLNPAIVAMAGSVDAFPQVVPMENDYRGSKYYVRKCYAEYYDVVMDLLRTKDGVALTGTPGIGTSLCMAYFFQRYSREHPDATIIMASYSMRSALRKVVVARGQLTLKVGYDEAAMEKALRENALAAAQAGDDATICLLDGIPKTIPVGDVHWVSFSTPEESWMKQLSKNLATCARLYMPVWTLEELREAALALNRPDLLNEVDKKELYVFGVVPAASVPRPAVLNVRFSVFGGVPRFCFAEELDWVEDYFGWLSRELYTISRDGVRSATLAAAIRAPSVLHFVPLARTPKLASIRLGSMAVEHFVAEREQAKAESASITFEQSVLGDVRETEAMRAFSLAARLYRRLQRECVAEATKMCGDGDKYLLLDSLHAPNLHRITSTFETVPFDHAEQQCASRLGLDLPPIRSFCWIPSPDRVVFFQVTASMQHPVNAAGYTKVLKALGLWEAAQQSPHTVVAVVFVVPKWNKGTFRAQPISSHPLLDDASPVTEIAGLWDETVNELARLEICTIRDLRAHAASKERLSKATWKFLNQTQAKLQQHESAERGAALQQVIHVVKRTPQYVWAI